MTRSRLWSGALAGMAVALAPAVVAEDPGAAPQGEAFLLSGHHQLRIDDKPVADARIYTPAAPGVPRLLIVAPALPQPVLVTAGAKTAAAIDPARLGAGAADSATLAPAPDGAAAAAPVPLSVDGTKLRATLLGHRLTIEPREPLVGELTAETMLAAMPEYRRNLAAYQPRRGDLRLLQTLQVPTQLDVFFGTWCPHCEKYVPRLLRVVQEVGNPNITLKLHGLPQRIDEDPLARQLKITAVPTGLVRRGEETVARLEGPNWERPESALAALLFGDAS